MACCYYSLGDYESCITYLEAVIYHFDSIFEDKHNVKITPECKLNLTFRFQHNKQLQFNKRQKFW